MSEIEIGREDNGKSWNARPGDTIRIRLPENPSTGYQWAAASDEAQAVRLESSDYSPSSGTGFGASGTRIFTFRALRSGNASIQLVLKRPWESGEAKERFSADFQVD